MTNIRKKQISTEIEEMAALIKQYAEVHKCGELTAADILRLTALTQIATELKSIDSTLEMMLGQI